MAARKKIAKKGQNSKPVKTNVGSKSPSKTAFDKAWREYNMALSAWKEALAQWQNATNKALSTYNNACQMALESDADLLKKVSASWEKVWGEIGPEYIKQQTNMIDGIFKETNLASIKKFNSQWKRFLDTSGSDSIKAYQEAIKKFNEAWQPGRP